MPFYNFIYLSLSRVSLLLSLFYLFSFTIYRKVKVFDGLFCEANYKEKFRGWLWVYPESKIVDDGTPWGSLFAAFGSERFESADRVRVDDSQFESIFRVYGSSLQDVHTILTPKLMRNLTTLHQKSDQVALTLSGRTVYVAIWTNKNYLEPSLLRPATDLKAIHAKLRDLEKMISIIEDLNVQYY